MKQMAVDENAVVPMDYESEELPPAVRQFKPLLYKEGEQFCCVLGPDPEQGIFACGATEDEALNGWNSAFAERLKSTADIDEVAQYIRDTMAISRKDVW